MNDRDVPPPGAASVEGSREGMPLLLFDGDCRFCNGWVDFVRRFAGEGVIETHPLGSEQGRRVLERAGLPDSYGDSIVLADDRGIWLESTAVVRLLRHCGFPLAALSPLVTLVPRPLRDRAYRYFARHRIAWFGRTSCELPPGRGHPEGG